MSDDRYGLTDHVKWLNSAGSGTDRFSPGLVNEANRDADLDRMRAQTLRELDALPTQPDA
jgi:hypothetical protein